MLLNKLGSVAVLAALGLFSAPALPHAEHGHGQPVPAVSSTWKAPKGVDLRVVKSNAQQFSLATDGKTTVQVLDANNRAFLKFEQGKVWADVDNPSWHRSTQPGGGAVPPRLKTELGYAKLPPRWQVLSDQPGWGWFDPRLNAEELKPFQIKLLVNNKLITVPVVPQKAAAFQGHWQATITQELNHDAAWALIPGLTSGAIALNRLPRHTATLTVLDASGKPFLLMGPKGNYVRHTHPWFNELGLFADRSKTHPTLGADWVWVSDSAMLTYQDPRLRFDTANKKAVQPWRIGVQVEEGAATKPLTLVGQARWVAAGKS